MLSKEIKETKFIGVIGSEHYKNNNIVESILEKHVNKETDFIVSGHSPTNKKYILINNKKFIIFDNVDIWSENWANKECKNKPIIFPAREFNEKEFFKRNKKIAEISTYLILFIPIRLYKCGAWNTLKHFLNKPETRIHDFMVINEYGKKWNKNDLPNWINKKLKKKV